MTAPRSLRVGLIGYGLGGSTFHAPLISATPGLELTAIATSDPGRVQAAAARHPHARIVPAADHLFKISPALDLVVVSTPHHTHAPLATAALAAGCHVVIDKPFAVSADEARELAALAVRYERLAIPFQNRRWDADILTLQRLLREGALGTVHRFEPGHDSKSAIDITLRNHHARHLEPLREARPKNGLALPPEPETIGRLLPRRMTLLVEGMIS